MAMTLTFAEALWGGAAIIAVLVGVYLFRTRSQPRVVGSLLLWVEHHRPAEGGQWLQRPQMPLLLALEILIVLLVALAAASPRGIAPGQGLPLVVVLDDSYSMRAGGADSPREQAIRAIEQEVAAQAGYQVRLLLAGQRPEFLGETCRAVAQLRQLWPLWTCCSPQGDLDLAIALARETRDHRTRLLVVTDRAPADPPTDGRVQWWAFGRPRANLAFINGGRTMFGVKDRGFFEVANLSSQPVRVEGTIDNGRERRFMLEIAATETRREVFDLELPSASVRIRLPGDDLPNDDELILLPPPQRPVRTAVLLEPGPLRELTERALAATGLASLATAAAPAVASGLATTAAGLSTAADLVVRAAAEAPPSPGQWVWEFLPASGTEAFLGPFALDRANPLVEGLALDGVVWASPATGSVPGIPVILLANTPLVTEERLAQGARRFRMRYDPIRSTLHQTPNWPILFWNLVRWRQSFLPGPAHPNLRLGMEVRLQVPAGRGAVQVTAPDGQTISLPAVGEAVVFQPAAPGLYAVRCGGESFAFAVNCLARQESDLRQSASGRWGDWTRSEAFRQESLDLGWAFLLPAALLLGVHLFLISVGGGGGRRP
ncbi:MAG: hypothetical protein OZSIB_3421 [Candidatus Ozemobacter sibiricus]|jgi:hypothetical protein|uniref:Aerotolerance regulator N-terminal domain-containing protein n=1 Tax=Candidatus Ozemobacter sibiricus TaxID=2268124 RepID=A0A367ZR65_9BACT|nr:MAG: hypothetical protein OZSIB_3421 [Candidatus Ozemobacter sibiricus]